MKPEFITHDRSTIRVSSIVSFSESGFDLIEFTLDNGKTINWEFETTADRNNCFQKITKQISEIY